jgi:CRP/FNR family transcriptional regulator, cyclic AMP receptor protein
MIQVISQQGLFNNILSALKNCSRLTRTRFYCIYNYMHRDVQESHREDFRIDKAELQEKMKIETFQQCRLFHGLATDDIKGLSCRAVTVHYKKGTSIFEEGNPADFFYVVQDGLVKVYKNTSSGKTLTFTVAGRGDTLNATAVSGDNYYMSAQTLNDVTVLRTGRKLYHSFLAEHSSIAIELVRVLSSRLDRECDRVVRLLGEDVEQRLIISLFTLARKFGTSLSLTREELANCAGTTTETAIRVLSRLKKQGIIGCASGRGGILVSDMAKLHKLVVEDEGWI